MPVKFPAPYLHQISSLVQKTHYIWCKFSVIIKRIYARTAPTVANWDEFSRQHQHQPNAKLALNGANFSWVLVSCKICNL